jgi:hypothetical protein
LARGDRMAVAMAMEKSLRCVARCR